VTQPSLVIHAGVYGKIANFNRAAPEQGIASISRILEEGRALLDGGASALDTVEHCVRELEDDPLFNAGRGGVANSAGIVELDAAIMNGATLEAGAVAGVTGIANPVRLARRVLETGYVMRVGPAAQRFAAELGFEIKDAAYFAIGSPLSATDNKTGTVGAVAYDKNGNIAAATSTGGYGTKPPGRVGDSPIIGAGTYAENETCGISTSGLGEHFIRSCFAHRAAMHIQLKGMDLTGALNEGITYLQSRFRDTIGAAIGIDRNGVPGVGVTAGHCVLHGRSGGPDGARYAGFWPYGGLDRYFTAR